VCQNGNYVIHLWFDKHFSFAWIISPYFFQIILQCICAVLHCYFSPNLWYFDRATQDSAISNNWWQCDVSCHNTICPLHLSIRCVRIWNIFWLVSSYNLVHNLLRLSRETGCYSTKTDKKMPISVHEVVLRLFDKSLARKLIEKRFPVACGFQKLSIPFVSYFMQKVVALQSLNNISYLKYYQNKCSRF